MMIRSTLRKDDQMTMQRQPGPAILQFISGRSIGGAEKIVIGLVREMRSRGFRIVTACRPGSWSAVRLSDIGCPVELITMKGLKARVLAPFKLRAIIRKYGINLIHTHMKLDSELILPLASKIGIPTVCTVHNTDEDLYCIPADRTTAISRAVESDLLQRGVSSERVSLVPNGIPIDDFERPRNGFRARYGLAESDIVVGAVCRLIPRKGMDILIRATAKCPGTKLVLAGYGKPKYARYLRNMAEELGVSERVIFTGRVEDPFSIYASLDVFAMPSRREGFGITMLEAMVAGVPVVASSIGGIPEVISNDKTGLLVPPDDPDALADAIRLLTTDKELACRIISAAGTMVRERYSVQKMADGFEGVYNILLSDRK